MGGGPRRMPDSPSPVNEVGEVNRRRMVYYRDNWMVEGWPEKLRDAQTHPFYVIDGKRYRRIPYGKEGYGVRSDIPCHDCLAHEGEYHVMSCDMERCPACGGQAFLCGCRKRLE